MNTLSSTIKSMAIIEMKRACESFSVKIEKEGLLW